MKNENEATKEIQNKIGYEFKNTDLMFQAFVRKSYSEENGGENNEVLEFIGDKVLDLVVVKLLAEKYGKITSTKVTVYDDLEAFTCQLDEGELTEKKRRLVEKKNLAERMLELGFSRYLIMNKGDLENRVQFSQSAMEDLFEALIGAVALDSDWNLKEVQNVVECMLNFDSVDEMDNDNYIDYLQQWSLTRHNTLPDVQITKLDRYETPSSGIYVKNQKRAKWQHTGPVAISEIKKCLIKLKNIPFEFVGYGYSNNEARKLASEEAYKYLAEQNLLLSISDEINAPNKNESISQLEILARRGYFSIPEYEFIEKHDKDGNPVWTCVCKAKEIEKTFKSKSSSKKEAKKTAALKMLNYVLKEKE